MKQSVYLSAPILREIRAEAKRLDRSIAWVVKHAWKISRAKIKESKGASKESEREGIQTSPRESC